MERGSIYSDLVGWLVGWLVGLVKEVKGVQGGAEEEEGRGWGLIISRYAWYGMIYRYEYIFFPLDWLEKRFLVR